MNLSRGRDKVQGPEARKGHATAALEALMVAHQ
jgi:hypothetical protein